MNLSEVRVDSPNAKPTCAGSAGLRASSRPRPPASTKDDVSIDVAKARKMKEDGLDASEIAKTLKIGRASVCRVLGEGPAAR